MADLAAHIKREDILLEKCLSEVQKSEKVALNQYVGHISLVGVVGQYNMELTDMAQHPALEPPKFDTDDFMRIFAHLLKAARLAEAKYEDLRSKGKKLLEKRKKQAGGLASSGSGNENGAHDQTDASEKKKGDAKHDGAPPVVKKATIVDPPASVKQQVSKGKVFPVKCGSQEEFRALIKQLPRIPKKSQKDGQKIPVKDQPKLKLSMPEIVAQCSTDVRDGPDRPFTRSQAHSSNDPKVTEKLRGNLDECTPPKRSKPQPVQTEAEIVQMILDMRVRTREVIRFIRGKKLIRNK